MHPDKYSSIFTTVILSCALHTFLAPSFFASYLTLPHLLPLLSCWCFRLHCCHILWDCSSHTDPVLTASLHLFFSCIFLCPFLLKEKALGLHSFFSVLFSSFHFILCPFLVLLKKWKFCSFMPNIQILVPCVFKIQRNPSYTSLRVLLCAAQTQGWFPQLLFCELNLGCKW